MRKSNRMILLLLLAGLAVVWFLLFHTGEQGVVLPEGKASNYLLHTGMLSSGDYFFVKADDGSFRCFGPEGEQSVDQNAIDALKHRELNPIGADEESFYFEEVVSAEQYGKGHGRCIYRYFPKDGSVKLLGRSTSVSNTDGLLGLDEVFGMEPLLAPHSNLGSIYYAFDGNAVFPGYAIRETLMEAAKNKNLQLLLPREDFRFASRGSNLFFADALGGLYKCDTRTYAFTRLEYDSVSVFFLKDDTLYVLPSESNRLDLLDVNLNKLASVNLDGKWIGHVCFDGDRIYFESGFEVYYIDGAHRVHDTGYFTMDNRWCVKNGTIYQFDGKTVRTPVY